MVVFLFSKLVVKIISFSWNIKFLLEKLNLFNAKHALAKKRTDFLIELLIQNVSNEFLSIFNSMVFNFGVSLPCKLELRRVLSSNCFMCFKKYLMGPLF